MRIHGHVDLRIITDPAEIAATEGNTGKPFLVMIFDDGTKQAITTNIAEMIGGAGTGARIRWEKRRRAH